jgi:hypothetical protein
MPHPAPQVPEGLTLEHRDSRAPDSAELALVRTDDGHVLAEVESIDGGERGFDALRRRVQLDVRALERVRRAIRAI